MQRKLIGAVLLGIAASSSAGATTRHVPADFNTIQAAMNASSAGDVVIVAPGTYVENLQFSAAHDGIRVESSAGAGATAIDGNGAGSVVSAGGVGALTEIRGFTLRGGSAGLGGGMLLSGTSMMVTDCIIEGNRAEAGGGVYSILSSPTFQGCVLRSNRAHSGSGGALYADYAGTTTMSDCLVYSNDCAAFGGGLTAWETATIVMAHCTVAGNSAALGGGNLYFIRGGRFTAVASIAAFPVAGANVEAGESPGNSTFSCCDFYVPGGDGVMGFPSPVGSSGTFSLDPQFCSLQVGEFGLMATSPCSPATNTNGCGQVGARDVECGAVQTATGTWGAMKSRYRGGRGAVPGR